MAFTRSELDSMLVLAESGLASIADLQDELISSPPPPRS
jgi:ribonuclease PH